MSKRKKKFDVEENMEQTFEDIAEYVEEPEEYFEEIPYEDAEYMAEDVPYEDVMGEDVLYMAEEDDEYEDIEYSSEEDDNLEYLDLSRPASEEDWGAPKKSLGFKMGIAAAVLLIGAVIAFFVYQNNLIYKVCRVEAGIPVSVADFLRRPDPEAYFTADSQTIDVNVPGEYHLEIKTGFFKHEAVLYIQDTIAPVVTVQPVDVMYGETYEAADFVGSVDDITATTVTFAEEPDASWIGEQKVTIAVTDAGGNVTKAEADVMIWPVVPSISVEVGGEVPDITKFLLVDAEAKFITRVDNLDYSKLGTHPVKVKVGQDYYTVDMVVVDTIAPVFDVQDIEGFTVVKREAADFVTSSQDMTAITYSFETEPDLTYNGTQTVTVVATDEGGNQSKQQAQLTLTDDTEAPKFTAGSDFTVYIGDSVSYKSKVKVKDNCAEGLELTVDTAGANTNQEGTYPITYTATDASGNATSLTLTMTVKKHMYDEAELWALVDPILNRIITADMSQYDKAWAIFNYIKGHVGYISYSEKGDWIRSACEGLQTGRGDCYVYASLSKAMLTRAGLPNVDIERIRKGDSMHFWNLVDIGDGHGWYHFDTTPRKDRPTIFLWDEATITQYSDTHNGSHNYDRSLYPTVY